MDLTLKVWRQKNAKAQGHFETYQVKNISSDSSFLEMLDILNEQLIAEGVEPELHKEPLVYENIKIATRNYKD